MSSYKAPLDDLRFALYDVLDAEAHFEKLGFAEVNRELADAVLDEAARFAETVLAPLNRVGDEVGCKFDKATGDVTPPPGFKEAFDQFAEGGWTGLTNDPEHGGQGMPALLGGVMTELVDAGNTVVVIEHNLDVVKTADWVLDLGPEGGDGGGRLVAEGTPEEIAAVPESWTGKFLAETFRRQDERRAARNKREKAAAKTAAAPAADKAKKPAKKAKAGAK